MISTLGHCDHCEMCRSEICLTLLRFVHQLCHNNFASLRAGDDGRIGDNICIAFTGRDSGQIQVLFDKSARRVKYKIQKHQR